MNVLDLYSLALVERSVEAFYWPIISIFVCAFASVKGEPEERRKCWKTACGMCLPFWRFDFALSKLKKIWSFCQASS